jgi:hypothetical protein
VLHERRGVEKAKTDIKATEIIEIVGKKGEMREEEWEKTKQSIICSLSWLLLIGRQVSVIRQALLTIPMNNSARLKTDTEQRAGAAL